MGEVNRKIVAARAHLLDIRDALRIGNIEAALDALEKALSGVAPTEEGLRNAAMMPFDQSFKLICMQHGVQAAFLALKALPPGDEQGNTHTMMTGGDGAICQLLAQALNPALPKPTIEQTAPDSLPSSTVPG